MKSIVKLLPLGAVLLTACTFQSKNVVTDFQYPIAGPSLTVAPVSVKDFEVKGVIFVKSQVIYDKNGEKIGSEITHEMLMREAVKLGADEVINVKIDEKDVTKFADRYEFNSVTKKETFVNRDTVSKAISYTASALAIKYTKTVFPFPSAEPASSKQISVVAKETTSAEPEISPTPVVQEKTSSAKKRSVFSRK